VAGDVAGAVEHILPRDRHAVERAEAETLSRPFGGGGFGAGALGRGAEIDIVLGIDALDACEEMFAQLAGVDLALPDGFAQARALMSCHSVVIFLMVPHPLRYAMAPCGRGRV
jgi:hypothetical protein